LAALADWPGAGRRMAVLGEMRELGPRSEAEHQELGRFTAGLGLARLVTVGEAAVAIGRAAVAAGMPSERVQACAEPAEAAAALAPAVRPGDVVLIKASRGARLERVIDALGAIEETH
jgi:UDP-N-acetylmuramoyl-tripeptide--D-alanyl-D-alanine ligase